MRFFSSKFQNIHYFAAPTAAAAAAVVVVVVVVVVTVGFFLRIFKFQNIHCFVVVVVVVVVVVTLFDLQKTHSNVTVCDLVALRSRRQTSGQFTVRARG